MTGVIAHADGEAQPGAITQRPQLWIAGDKSIEFSLRHNFLNGTASGAKRVIEDAEIIVTTATGRMTVLLTEGAWRQLGDAVPERNPPAWFGDAAKVKLVGGCRPLRIFDVDAGIGMAGLSTHDHPAGCLPRKGIASLDVQPIAGVGEGSDADRFLMSAGMQRPIVRRPPATVDVAEHHLSACRNVGGCGGVVSGDHQAPAKAFQSPEI